MAANGPTDHVTTEHLQTRPLVSTASNEMKHFLTLFALLTTSLAFGQESCPNLFDSNSNGAVDIEDFLAVLSLFSDVDSDSDGIWDSQDDCIDLEACNYAASPSEPCAFIDVLGECGGGCEGDGDGDGICDDVDDCVGVVDECGVCNGPGPTEVVIEDITILYDSVYAEQIDQWFVFEVGADTTFSYECVPLYSCGDPVSYQGYDYATVLIGDQCWFAENLRSENYENGDAIPAGLSESEWQGTTLGAVTAYGEGPNIDESGDFLCFHQGDACDEAWSLTEYGRLYNWYAVDDARGLCPSGWHVPTDGEWTLMTDNLDSASVAGAQMKTTYGWNNGGNGTNTSGFSGLPGGARSINGYFIYVDLYGFWWSSSPTWGLELYASNDYAVLDDYHPNIGFSVRCIQDSE